MPQHLRPRGQKTVCSSLWRYLKSSLGVKYLFQEEHAVFNLSFEASVKNLFSVKTQLLDSAMLSSESWMQPFFRFHRWSCSSLYHHIYFSLLPENICEAGEMAQWVKCLLIPSAYMKSMAALVEIDRQIPHWPASLAKFVRSRFIERLSQKSGWRTMEVDFQPLCACATKCTHIPT